MRQTGTVALALTALLTLAACGTEAATPGAGEDPSTGAEDPGSSPDDAAADDLVADTRGEGHFLIDSLAVRQAESQPVQLFLEVEGNAPTPCHAVAYDVEREGETILVHLTTVENTDLMCTQVLVPYEIAVPLGEAEHFPVTIDVNDGEHILTVDG